MPPELLGKWIELCNLTPAMSQLYQVWNGQRFIVEKNPDSNFIGIWLPDLRVFVTVQEKYYRIVEDEIAINDLLELL